MANSKVLVAELYPIVSSHLQKKENITRLKRGIESYLDRNNDKLTTLGPIHRTVFLDSDMKVLYDATGLNPQTIKAVLKKCKDVGDDWKIINNPFNVASMMAIRYFKMVKNKDMAKLTLIYLTLSMYPSLHFKYFQHEPNEKIMNYTINNLSNKYKIKKAGVFYIALIETAEGADINHHDRLLRGEDKDFVNYINDVKTRVNMMIRKISNEFYENKEKELYINIEQESMEEDNYREAESNIYAIEKLSNGVVLKLIVNGPNMKLVTAAAKLCKVSVSELRNYASSMITSENKDEIKQIVESILFLYLFDDKNRLQEINSDKFLMYCMDIYKKSNTTDKNIIKIKSILDGWLERLGTYKKTQRLNTINDFRRALYIFFVVSIQYSNLN